MVEYVAIPPGTAIIDAIRAERSMFHSWAGEAIDNSLDANATTVNLIMNGDVLMVEDDGRGITKDRDDASVQIAQHGEMESTKLGRFGIGIKYKAIQHGNVMEIHSVSKDGKLRRSINWQKMRDSNAWLYQVPSRVPVSSGEVTWTRIAIRDLRKKPTNSDVIRTVEEIQRTYYPALEQGKSIILNGETISPIVRPPLTKMIDTQLEFPGGRRARVRAGMLSDPSTAKLKQVDLCMAFRIIKKECAFGCNGYSGIRAMYALVELNDKWKLTKFKDDIADDPYEEKLEAAVEEVLRPILELCESSSMVLKTKKLETLINELIPPELRASRPEKKVSLGRKGEKRGDKTPKSVIDSIEAKSGPVKNKRRPPGILIEFAKALDKTHGYGRALIGRSEIRIQLSDDNPHINLIKQNRDVNSAAIGIYAIATLLLKGEQLQDQQELAFEPLGLRAWKLARQQDLPQAAE